MTNEPSSDHRSRQRRRYRAGVALVVVASIVTVWTTLVRDDGNGLGFLLLIVTAGIGAFSAWFRPGGMARTMVGVGVMQGLVAIAVATTPAVERAPSGALKVLLCSAFCAAIWLAAAALFWAAAKAAQDLVPAR